MGVCLSKNNLTTNLYQNVNEANTSNYRKRSVQIKD